MISMITATSINGIIGVRGSYGLLWDSPKDIDIFKTHTEGKIVVMGNNTFKSIGQPLDNRINVVLSKTEAAGTNNGVRYFNNISDILSKYNTFVVIGGEAVYNLFLPVADEVLTTTISIEFEGDENYAYFPLDKLEAEFYQVEQSEIIQDQDTQNGVPLNLIFSRWHRGATRAH